MEDLARNGRRHVTDVVEDEDAAPLDSLALFVHSQGKTAQVHTYGLPSNIPKAPEPVVRSFSTLILDAWGYGKAWGNPTSVITHNGAWGFCVRPEVDGESEYVAKVGLSSGRALMGAWLAATALYELSERCGHPGRWIESSDYEDSSSSDDWDL